MYVNRVDIASLDIGTVIMVDTEDECLKLVVDYDIGVIDGYCVHVSMIVEDPLDIELDLEEERGTFMISHILVGKPIEGVLYPKTAPNGTIEIGGILQTTAVKSIDVYQDSEAI